MSSVTRAKAIKILENRVAFLDARIAKCLTDGVTPGYDYAEISAIRLAIRALERVIREDKDKENADA